MKKIMVGILVVIPVLILVVIGAVTTFVSTRTHIAVEEITLDRESADFNISPDAYNLNDLFEVKVLPEKASDKSYVWSIADLRYLDSGYENEYNEYLKSLETYEAKYAEYREQLIKYDADYNEWLLNKDDPDWTGVKPVKPTEPEKPIEIPPAATLVDSEGATVSESSLGLLKVNSYCSFYLVVQAETMQTRCFAYVGGVTVENVTVKGANTIHTGESSLLEAVFAPIDSIVTDLRWTSSNENVLRADANGVITGVSEGTAAVRVLAKKHNADEYVSSAEFTVTVEKGASGYGNKITTDREVLSLSELGIEEYGEFTGCVIENGAVSLTAGEASVETPRGTVNILRCSSDQIKFEHGEIFAYDRTKESSYLIESGGTSASLRLKAIWASDTKSGVPDGVLWSSSDEEIATVENGIVTGIKRGFVVITAAYGEETVSIELAVGEKVTALVLDITDSSLRQGIARETVFGSQIYKNAATGERIANSIEIGFVRPVAPEDEEEYELFMNSFTYSVNDGSKAYFEGNVLVFKPENITEKTVLMVTVKAKHPKYQHMQIYTTSTFNVTVVPGITVYTLEELQRAAQDGGVDEGRAEKLAICFGANIKANKDGQNCSPLDVWHDVYGNNKMYYADLGALGARGNDLFNIKMNFDEIKSGRRILLSNIILRANEAGEEINNGEDTQSFNGSCVQIDGRRENPMNVRIEYSILENANMAIECSNSLLQVEGCIIRNTLEVAIWVPCDINPENQLARYSKVNIKNCVMSNMLGMAIALSYDGFTRKSEFGEEAARALAEQKVAEGKNTTLTQEGFLDIYNWQTMDALSLIPTNTAGEQFEELFEILNSAIADLVLTDSLFKDFRTLYSGKTYVHFGFFSQGLLEKSYAEVHLSDKRFGKIDSRQISDSALKVIFGKLESMYIWGYRNDISDLLPGKAYSVNAVLIDHLHGLK